VPKGGVITCAMDSKELVKTMLLSAQELTASAISAALILAVGGACEEYPCSGAYSFDATYDFGRFSTKFQDLVRPLLGKGGCNLVLQVLHAEGDTVSPGQE
jgi:hypothetical protein